MHQFKSLCAVVIALLSLAAQSAELAIKYQFVPSHQVTYQTSVVKPAKTTKVIQTAVVSPPKVVIRKTYHTQVVAARNYEDQQPLAPTLSYSYSQSKASTVPQSVVIAARNYSEKVVNLTHSDINKDSLETYIVGALDLDLGYSEFSKGPLRDVELKINQNPLVGCAPLNINCSRTATDSDSLDIEREPLTPSVEHSRQQVTP